ncbi:MAG: malonyl-CoA decarboxylase [Burkholderiaceae bacterium]
MSRSSYFQDLLTSVFERGIAAVRSDRDDRPLAELCEALMSVRGEVSGQRLAAAVLDRFDAADAAERLTFFTMLSEEFDVDARAIARAATAYGENNDSRRYAALLEASEPKRLALLRRLNSVPGGTARLVRMRAALLPLLREYPAFQRLDHDFEHLFGSWFNRGFLVLRHIDWRSPANLLEKIIAYEAVHAINDWDDLRRRTEPRDRRCFAFFHPAMPDEPLIFVEVALTSGIPDSIQAVLAEDREPMPAERASTAVFYSISNCQEGLRGVSFGNFLIKQVARDLAEELPQLKQFVTLSPVPGLMNWVRKAVQEPGQDSERAALLRLLEISQTGEAGPERVAGLELSNAERASLLGQAARYLCDATRADGLPLDPVARFHLGNGALLARLNWNADATAKGYAQSAGVMVNYLYELDKVEARHETYQATMEVAMSREVRGLAEAARKLRRTREARAEG